MAKTCAQCNTEYKGDTCPTCTETGVDIGKVLESEKEQMEKNESASVPTAFLVDLVSNRKIPITTPRCRVGRDDLNDIVISGDQSISRFHFIITYEDSQYYVQDAKSRHGTFLNGNQISGPEAINDGDVLKIGVSLFWFVIESAQGGSEESLQPVDVEKIASEELSLKKGSNIAAMSEAELTATMEIDLPTAESLAAAEAKVMEAAAAKVSKGDEEASVDKAEPAENKEEVFEPESRSDKTEDKEEDREEAKEEAAKADVEDDDKAEPESEKKDDAPAQDESKSAKVTSESDIEMTVKDLLEPLQDELEASRAMIKDALKKGNLKDEEEPAKSESEATEPESKKDEDESKEPEAEEKPESKEDEEKGAEPVSEDKPTSEEAEPEDKQSEEVDSKSDSDTLSVAGLDVEPTEIEVSGLNEEKDEAPESKGDEPKSTQEESKEEESKEDEEPEPESKNESEESTEPAEKSGEDAEADSSTKDKTTVGKSAQAETLEKIAEIIDDSSSKQEAEPEPEASREIADSEKESGSRDDDGKTTHAEPATMETANGAEEEITIMGPTNVPDWCKKYFSDELKSLTKELDSLNEQIKQTQERIRKIEGKAALTKGLRNTLLTADGDDLIEACVKVLGLAGWEVTQSEDDKNELVLAHGDEQVAIARIIWTKDKAERSHLGQLSISQTRYWCENGVEPKGILILSKLSDKAPTDRANEADPDLVTYAQQKNVCLMDTVQLLALYRDLALKDGKTDEKRGKIQDGKGWLSGFELEPGDEMDDEGEKEATKKSLSSLLSA